MNARIKEWNKAVKEVQNLDQRLVPWIKRLDGQIEDFELDRSLPPYDYLARSIIGQQISGAAARSITQRFLDYFPGRKINYRSLLQLQDEELKAFGISANKAESLRDLAHHVTEMRVPSEPKLETLTDEELIHALTPIRGIGVWTVQMLLIFRLGRMDVFPHDDLVVKKGYMRLIGKTYGKHVTPKPKKLISASEIWKPYRTVVAKLFWAIHSLEP